MTQQFFDTLTVTVPDAGTVLCAARSLEINLREVDAHTVGISLR